MVLLCFPSLLLVIENNSACDILKYDKPLSCYFEIYTTHNSYNNNLQ